MYKKIFLILLVFGLLSPELATAQCSMCRAVLESEEGQNTAKGINDGIVYLMAIPYVLVAIVGWRVVKMMKD
ncbi:MAG: hypothetical protein HN591_05265 [Flavobacteriales bacterium]|jgi:hypothetical protein|nr:hypothetical protein [Flavobacteriales bacterium]MBT7656055.1 hypothetical protein [Flavobacteriales bacterium]MDG1271988.1 hypothetical protein [Flavobacteriaceae bacterium]